MLTLLSNQKSKFEYENTFSHIRPEIALLIGKCN